MKDSQRNMYEEKDFAHVHTGDTTELPKAGTLVAIHTASSGLVNVITTGEYNFRKSPCTYYYNRNERHSEDEPDFHEVSMEGSFLITIKVRYPNSTSENERFLDELHPPLTIREKELIKNGKA